MGTTTRRAMLSAIAAAPLVATASAAFALPITLADTGDFAEARAAVGAAKQAADAYRRDVFDPAWARYSRPVDAIPAVDLRSPEHVAALDATGFHKVEEDYGQFLDAVCDAREAMILTPAPDLGALADKLDAMIAEETWNDIVAPEAMAALHADVRRLAGREG